MKIYEDGVVVAHLKEDGAVVGHIVVEPKQEAKTLADLPEDVVVQLWYCASFAATAVFEGLGAQGTNILCYEGERVELHVLARQPQDSIDIMWDANKADPGALSQTAKKVKEQFWYVGKTEENAPVPPKKTDAPTSPKAPAPDKSDPRITHLRRNP